MNNFHLKTIQKRAFSFEEAFFITTINSNCALENLLWAKIISNNQANTPNDSQACSV